MSIITSSQFASTAAAGENWREASKAVLEKLETVKKQNPDFNFGFLYISDHLADNATSILSLFSSVLEIDNWIGTAGIVVCSNDTAYIDQPAISAMIGAFDEDEFFVFPGKDYEPDQIEQVLSPWLQGHDPMMICVHGDPMAEEDPAQALITLEALTGGYLVGGLSSSRKEHVQFANSVFQGGLSGAAFSQNVMIATTLSQGCNPIGNVHTITRGSGHTILELNENKASEVFEDDLRTMAIKKIDRNPDEILIDEDALESGTVPEEYHSVLKGEVHAAFPVAGSDQNDYLVRNIIGVDQDEGSITIAQTVSTGETVMFVHRDDQTVQEDLSKSLMALRERVTRDTGRFEPKGGIYVSCVARAFGDDNQNTADQEMKLIKEIIGDIPLTGFYAGGEITNARLYGYTGVLTLFL